MDFRGASREHSEIDDVVRIVGVSNRMKSRLWYNKYEQSSTKGERMRKKKRVGNQEGECRRRLSPARISLAYSRDGSRIQHGTLSVVRSFGKSRCILFFSL